MFSDQVQIFNLTLLNSPSWNVHPIYSRLISLLIINKSKTSVLFFSFLPVSETNHQSFFIAAMSQSKALPSQHPWILLIQTGSTQVINLTISSVKFDLSNRSVGSDWVVKIGLIRVGYFRIRVYKCLSRTHNFWVWVDPTG